MLDDNYQWWVSAMMIQGPDEALGEQGIHGDVLLMANNLTEN